MDKIDKKILRELQLDSDKKVYQIARKLNIPKSTVHNRIKKLEKLGIITRYKAIVDPKKLDKAVCALVHIVITSKQSAYQIAEKLKKMPNIEEIDILTGQFDIMAKVRLKNTEELSKFIFDSKTGLKTWPGIERTESMIILDAIKEYGIIEPD